MATNDLTASQKNLDLTLGVTKIQHGLRWSKLDQPGAPERWSIVMMSETPQGLEDLNRFLFYMNIPTKKELSRMDYAAEVLGMVVCTAAIPAGNVILMNEGWMATIKVPSMTFTVARLPDYVWQAFKVNYDRQQAALRQKKMRPLWRVGGPKQS
jgi:hypothetical protein